MKIHDVALIAEDGDNMEVHRSRVGGMLFARWRGSLSIHLSPEQAIAWGEILIEAGQRALEREAPE